MELNRIYCGDNDNVLAQIRDEKIPIHLCITDPPYNVGKDFGNDSDSQTKDAFLDFLAKRFRHICDCLIEKASIVSFCSHIYLADTTRILKNHEMTYLRTMIWHYRNGMSRQKNSPVTEFEPMLWFTKGSEWTYNGDDVRVPYRSERVKNPVYKRNKNGEKIAWLPDPRGAKRGDVWEYPCLAGKLYEDERTEHPTQKPEELITDLIKAFCPKNAEGYYEGNVLDPFCGSGTLPVCCEKLNWEGHKIKWIGIELEQKWVDIGNERIANIKMPNHIM